MKSTLCFIGLSQHLEIKYQLMQPQTKLSYDIAWISCINQALPALAAAHWWTKIRTDSGRFVIYRGVAPFKQASQPVTDTHTSVDTLFSFPHFIFRFSAAAVAVAVTLATSINVCISIFIRYTCVNNGLYFDFELQFHIEISISICESFNGKLELTSDLSSLRFV